MNEKIEQITVVSSIDGSVETSLLFKTDLHQPRPLLVSLHSWSAGMHGQAMKIIPLAEHFGWNALFPNFRGPNLRTNPRARQACASEEARQDIMDAILHLEDTGLARKNEVYIMGGSGGGHMALMMAAHSPTAWQAVIAFCPITDLIAWHTENQHYAPHIEACFGGPPDTPARISEYRERSPIYNASEISRARVYLLHGRRDDSVPFSHSLRLFEKTREFAPDARMYIEIFDGGHEQRLYRAREILRELRAHRRFRNGISG